MTIVALRIRIFSTCYSHSCQCWRKTWENQYPTAPNQNKRCAPPDALCETHKWPKSGYLCPALEEMIDTGAVLESKSTWASPMVIALKKDCTAILCVDFWRLNAVSVKVSCPFPSTSQWGVPLEMRLFLRPSNAAGEFSIEVHSADVQNTACICYKRLVESTCLPFESSFSISSFQRLMHVVFMMWKGVRDGIHGWCSHVFVNNHEARREKPTEIYLGHLKVNIFSRSRRCWVKIKVWKCSGNLNFKGDPTFRGQLGFFIEGN